MRNQTIVESISCTLQAIHNCEISHDKAKESNDEPMCQHWAEWCDRHAEKIESICKNQLPHGSGFDSGTKFDFDASKPDRLVFHADFHHMDDGGYYCGWSEHQVIVTPSLAFGFNIRITGVNRRDIKEYIAETFNYALSCEVQS